MKNFAILYFIFSISFPVFSQEELLTFEINEENIEREVLSKFFWELPFYTYVDKNIRGFEKPSIFISKHKREVRSMKIFDSICRNSEDIEKLRYACPSSDGLPLYESLFTENELQYIRETYKNEKEPRIIDVNSYIKDGIPLKKHPEEFYIERRDRKYRTASHFEGYPSVEILDIYYTENRQKAIIVFAYNSTHGTPGYYLLENVRGIYWKPVGNYSFKK